MNESQSRVIAYLLVTVVNGLPTQAIAIPTDKTGEATESFSVSSPASVEDPMAQVTSVSQLRDVQPTDWAFSALQSLVERYGCIAGYPDGTYRGDHPLSRYEFAAGLNACLDRVNEFIATATSDLVAREDLITLEKLQAEFATELAAVRGRVNNLEARTAEITANQFSTTTKLSSFTIVGMQGRTDNRADLNPRDGKKETDDPSTNINIIYYNQFLNSR